MAAKIGALVSLMRSFRMLAAHSPGHHSRGRSARHTESEVLPGIHCGRPNIAATVGLGRRMCSDRRRRSVRPPNSREPSRRFAADAQGRSWPEASFRGDAAIGRYRAIRRRGVGCRKRRGTSHQVPCGFRPIRNRRCNRPRSRPAATSRDIFTKSIRSRAHGRLRV